MKTEATANLPFDLDEDTTQDTKVSVQLSNDVVLPCISKTTLDSDEEKHFLAWLNELVKEGYVSSYDHHPSPFLLSSAKTYNVAIPRKTMSAKVETRELIKPHIYTPDFYVVWTDKAYGVFIEDIKSIVTNRNVPFLANYDKNNNRFYSIMEVKADFDQNNMTRLFVINQKWILESGDIYIDLCKIPSLFKKTFTPSSYLFTEKKHQPRKLKFTPLSLSDYVKLHTHEQKLF